jgi:hypothetical protein
MGCWRYLQAGAGKDRCAAEDLSSSTLCLFGVLSSDKSTPGDLLDAKLKQLQAQMAELKLAVSCSQGVGFLKDHTIL